MPLRHCLLPIVYCLFLTSCSSSSQTKADLIIHHAKIYTVDSSFSVAEAMAIKDGKILAIGKEDEIMKKYDAVEIKDVAGKAIYPGFIDAHAHFVGYGSSLQNVNLVDTKSWEECIEKVKAFIVQKNIKPNEWIKGRGWDQNDWEKKEFPTKELLDAAFPSNPVVLTRIDGHALIANQVALDLAKIQAGQTLEGGTVETKDGKLTGILIDNAQSLVRSVIPGATKEQYGILLQEAQANCFAVGLTTVVDCGLSHDDVEKIDALQKEGKLKMRMDILLSDDSANYAHYLQSGPYKTERLNVNGFKLYADGALGSRGACLLEFYSDKPGWRGFLLKDRKYFESIIPKIFGSKFQACTHAIGDSGNRMILEVYASVLKGNNDRRWRVEHAQVVNENDFHFFGDYNIVPSVQPTHEHIALAEAKKLNISTFGMVDTNCDPNKIDFAIPANDDATKSISIIVNYLTAAISEGLQERQADKDEDESSDTEESAEAKAARFEQKQGEGDDRGKRARGTTPTKRRVPGPGAGGRRPATGGAR